MSDKIRLEFESKCSCGRMNFANEQFCKCGKGMKIKDETECNCFENPDIREYDCPKHSLNEDCANSEILRKNLEEIKGTKLQQIQQSEYGDGYDDGFQRCIILLEILEKNK